MTDQKLQFPTISKPLFIGEFGNDHTRQEIIMGRSKMRYLYEPLLQEKRVRFDLNHGFETFQPKPLAEERIDALLKYIMAISEKGTNLRKIIHDSQFVTWRGSLTRIASSPYLSPTSDSWRIVCYKFEGVIFLCELTADAKLEKQANETEMNKRMTYWGHKFEQYLTMDSIDEKPSTSEPVSTCIDYCAVFKLQAKSQRGNHVSIFLGAEMDGIDGRGEFVELKTQFQRLGLGRFWPEKEMKWWIQSYLVGIERLIIGLRDKNGVIERLQEVKTHDLRQQRIGWEPATCMNYLFDYLDEVRRRLNAMSEGELLLSDYTPSNKSLIFREIQEQEREAFQFLPVYFTEHFKK